MSVTPLVEPLYNSQITAFPEEKAGNHDFWKIVCKIAAVAVLVIFTVLAALGVVLSSLYAPNYFLLVSVFVALTTPTALNGYAYIQSWANRYAVMADKARLISRELAALPSTSDEIRDKLKELGIEPSIEDCTILRSAFARYNYLEARATEKQAKRLKKEEEVKKIEDALARYNDLEATAAEKQQKRVEQEEELKKEEEKPSVEKLQEVQLEILKLREKVAFAHIRAAYLRGILANPMDRRTSDELFTKIRASCQSRLVNYFYYKDTKGYDVVLIRKQQLNNNPHFLKIRDVETSTTAQLTAFIFAKPEEIGKLLSDQNANAVLNPTGDQNSIGSQE